MCCSAPACSPSPPQWCAAGRHRRGRTFDLEDARALDASVRALYGRRAAVASAALWRLAGWVAGAGAIWLTRHAFGHRVSLAEAIMLASLSQAARTAAFVIPGGLGVQDGTLVRPT